MFSSIHFGFVFHFLLSPSCGLMSARTRKVSGHGKLNTHSQAVNVVRCLALQTTAKVAPEDVIRNLQATLPPMPAQPPSYIELENVPPWLLLAPVQPHSHIASDLAGGGFDLGDRVVSLSASGTSTLRIRFQIWEPICGSMAAVLANSSSKSILTDVNMAPWLLNLNITHFWPSSVCVALWLLFSL